MIAFKKWTGMFGGKTSDTGHKVQVRVPRDYFRRADVFLEDVKVMTKEHLPGLNKAFLVKLLFDNFLEKIRHDIDLYDYLVFLSESYGSIVTEAAGHDSGGYKAGLPKKSVAASGVSRFRWSLPANQSGKAEEDDCPTLSITLHPREVNRVEVFFDDLRWKRLPIDMELDELVSLLFIEFIVALRNGLTEETKQDIMDFIVSRWEER
ncbi:hypothetical protein ACFQI7_09370 [Paenibacillus allorhizosphaerae]|uniref:Uncharacterized protein n=1 Tax=Paenibacillus allorhizosphaerae TaxID=2849866 RepID=A0ABM8VIH6_9BACL|nr:hypothetical protein [Paenibacillus allorhizosphaerae]CAG7644221.1 hypothetical protein PAECIP111802_03185 [Paenibacillus allorhizosphaerae]